MTTDKIASSALQAPFRPLWNDTSKRRHREPNGWLSLHRRYETGAGGTKIMKDEKFLHLERGRLTIGSLIPYFCHLAGVATAL